MGVDMSLLSDKELWALVPNADNLNDARAIEAAILAKLASAELPEPQKYPADCFMREVNVCDSLAVSIAIQQAHAQGFAAGAAAQLAEKPSAWKWTANKFHDRLEDYCPPDDAYDEGTLIELYTRKEAK